MLDRVYRPQRRRLALPRPEALPALTLATGDYRLLELVAEKCGCRIARGEEALLAEIGALTLQEKSVKSRLRPTKEPARRHAGAAGRKKCKRGNGA